MKRARALYASTPAGFAWERKDCGVRALRCAANMSYAAAHRALEREGRQPGHITYDRQMSRLLIFQPRDLDPAPTLTQFLAANPTGRFVVRAARHYFAIVDKTVHNYGPRGAGPRCRIVKAWRVNGG